MRPHSVLYSRGTHDDGELELEDGEEAEGDGSGQVRVRLVAHIPSHSRRGIDNRESTAEATAESSTPSTLERRAQ